MFYLLIGLCSLFVLWRLCFKKQSTLEPPDLSWKLPIVGHGMKIIGDGVKMYNGIKQLSTEALEKGGVVNFYIGPIKFYAVSDPEDSLTICGHCLEKHYFYNFARPIFANGILNADAATWKIHRKLLNPAFSQQVLDNFIEIFNTQATSLVDQFANELGQPFNHEEYLRINNLETICSTAAGVTPDEYGNLQKEYLPCLEELLQIFNERAQKFWLHYDTIFNISSLKKKQDKASKKLIELSNSIIQKKKMEMKIPAYTENKSGKLKPFIELILQLAEEYSSFTDEQVRGETTTIIAGGHDTTASALTFALTLLGSHPHVQKKAYEEILHVLGNSNRSVDKEDLSKLVYAEAILKETLRLYPSVPVIIRQLDKDIKLKNYTLKADTACLISIYGVQRHRMWGSDANEFRPERWLDKETLPESKYFAAFGLARRTCIGKMYAIMAMKIMLTHVLRAYRISSDMSKMEVKMNTMIRPASGFYITLQKRNTNI